MIKGFELNKTGARVSELLDRHYIVPTLDNTPTSNTTQWQDGEYLTTFRIGELCRVKEDGEWIFYRLCDITSDGAVWQRTTHSQINAEEWFTLDKENGVLKTVWNLVSEKSISAKGVSTSGGGSSEGSANTLYQLLDVLKDSSVDKVSGAEEGNILTFSNGLWKGLPPRGNSEGGVNNEYVDAAIQSVREYIDSLIYLDNGVLFTDHPFASHKSISAKGIGNSSDSTVNYDRLDSWDEYNSSKDGYVLSAKLGYDLKEQIENLDFSDIELNNYYTKEEVNALISPIKEDTDKHKEILKHLSVKDGVLWSDISFASEKSVSAKGISTSGETGGSGIDLLMSWPTSWDSKFNSYALGAGLGWELKEAIKNIDIPEIDVINAQLTELGEKVDGHDLRISSNESRIKDFTDKIATIEKWFVLDEENGILRTTWNLVSDLSVSAKGVGINSGNGGGGSVNILDNWENYNDSTKMYALSAKLGAGLRSDIQSNTTNINTLSGEVSLLGDRFGDIEVGYEGLNGKVVEIEKNYTDIKGKVDDLTTWFKIDKNGNVYTPFNFYSLYSISAKGVGSSSSGGEGGASTLYQLIDVQSNSNNSAVEGAEDGNVLTFRNGFWKGTKLDIPEVDFTEVNNRIDANQSAIESEVTRATAAEKALNDRISPFETILSHLSIKDGALWSDISFVSEKSISAKGVGTSSGGSSEGGANTLYQLWDVLKDENTDKVAGAIEGSVLTYNGTHWVGTKLEIPNIDLTDINNSIASLQASNEYLLSETNKISGLQTAVEELSEDVATNSGNIEKLLPILNWFTLKDGVLTTEHNLVSKKSVSAKGVGTNGETGNAGALYQLFDVKADGDKVQGAVKGSVLTYDGTHWVGTTITIPEVNFDEVNGRIDGIEGNLDTLQGSYDALADELHTFLTGTDTDKTINKWKELEKFLEGYDGTNNLAELLLFKADKSDLDKLDSTVQSNKNKIEEILATLADWFTLEGNVLKTKYNLASDKSVSAKGIGTGGNSGGVSFDILTDWSNYDSSQIMALSATLGKDLKDAIENIKLPSVEGLATTEYVEGLFNSNFTKANIKSTLGISDWALTTVKPSYTTSEVTEGTNLYFTDARAVAALKSTTDALSGRITDNATAISNEIKRATEAENALDGRLIKVEDWFTLEDGVLVSKYSIASEKAVSAKGIGTGGSGSGISYDRLDTWDSYTSDKAGYVLSAKLGWDLKTRLDNLDLGDFDLSGYYTAIEVNQLLSGKQDVISDLETIRSGAALGATALQEHQDIYGLTIKGSDDASILSYTPNSKAAELTLAKSHVGLGNVDNLAAKDYFTKLDSHATTGAIIVEIGGTKKTIPASALKDSLSLNNVENTKLSTWNGTSNITTVGTITSGTWNGTKIANAFLANSKITIAGNDVSLGGSVTAATLQDSLDIVTLSDSQTITGAKTFSALLTANGGVSVPSTKTIKIGGGTISWDSTNNAFKFSHSMYSLGAVSSKGIGSSSGGGGGVDVDWLNFPSSIVPLNDTYDLGSNAQPWDRVFASYFGTDNNYTVITGKTIRLSAIVEFANGYDSIDADGNASLHTIYAESIDADSITVSGNIVATLGEVDAMVTPLSQTLSGVQGDIAMLKTSNTNLGYEIAGIKSGLSQSYYTKTDIDNKGFATKTWVNEEIGKIDVNVDLSNYYTKTETNSAISSAINKLDFATGDEILDMLSNYITTGDLSSELSFYQPLIDSNNKVPYSLISGTPSLATVATSGSYNDLTNTPTLGAAASYGIGSVASGNTGLVTGGTVYSYVVGAITSYDSEVLVTKYAKKATTLAGYGITDGMKVGGEYRANWNDNKSNGSYYVSSSSTNRPASFGQMLVMHNGDTTGQLYVGYNSGDNMYWRGMVDAAATVMPWRKILDESNFSSYALPLTGGEIKGSLGVTVNITAQGGTFANGLKVGDNDVIHSGNIGSQSVNYATSAGNADTLDGVHKLDIYGFKEALNLSTLLNNDGIAHFFYDYATSSLVAGQPRGDYVSDARGVMSFGNGYPLQISWRYNNAGDMFARSYYNGWTSWKQFAFTDSNVASATKLATARTIWGQSFDGTGNVSGALALGGSSKIYWHSDANNYYINADYSIADNAPNLNYCAAKGHRFVSGSVEIMRLLSNGSVLIGTTTDSYKGILQVNGSVTLNNIEFIPSASANHGGYMDFHYQGSTDDYTSRIIEDSSSSLCFYANYDRFGGAVTIGSTSNLANTNSVKLYVNGKSYFATEMETAGSLKLGGNISASGGVFGGCGTDYGLYISGASTHGGIYLHSKGTWKRNMMYFYPNGNMEMLGSLTVSGAASVGSLTVNGATAATQDWVTNRGYATQTSVNNSLGSLSAEISAVDARIDALGTAAKKNWSGASSADTTNLVTIGWVESKLGGYATAASIPTKTSQLTNDSNFLSGHIETTVIGGGTGLVTGGAVYSFVEGSLSGYAKKATTLSGYGITDALPNSNPSVTGTLTVAGAVSPSANDTYALGSTNYRWSKLYANGVDCTGAISSTANITAQGNLVAVNGGVSGNTLSISGSASVGSLTVGGNAINFSNYALKTDIPSLSGYATQSWVNTKLGGYATQTSIPTKVSQLTNDSKFITDGVSSFKVGTYDGLSVAGTYLGAGSIVVKESAPSIKFLVKSYTSNYTSIIEEATANVLNINGQVYAKKDGNVAIGTSTINNSYKLYVNGATYFKGNSYVSGTFTATNNAQFRGAYIADSNLTGGYDGSTVWSVTPEGAASFKSLTVNGVAITGNGGFNGGTVSNSITMAANTHIKFGGSLGGTITGTYDGIDRLMTFDAEAIFHTGYFGQSSDATLKSIIKDVRLSLGTMANAPLVQFDWKNRTNKKHHVGTIAQYWDSCLPEVVSRTKDGTLALGYGELGVAMGISLAKEMTDMLTRMDNTETEVDKLKKRISELEKEIETLMAA